MREKFHVFDLRAGNRKVLAFYCVKDSIREAWRQKIKRNSTSIFLHGSENAATFSASVRFAKSNGASSELRESDIRKLFSKSTEQFYNRYFEEAKKRLGTDEFSIALVQSRVSDLKLDDQAVINPVGARAGTAELQMEQTFLKREALEDLRSNAGSALHLESSSAIRDALSPFYPDREFYFAEVLGRKTRIFNSGRNPRYFGAVSYPLIQKKCEIPLSEESLDLSLARELGIAREALPAFGKLYRDDELSKRVNNYVERIIRAEAKPLLEKLREFKKLALVSGSDWLASFAEKNQESLGVRAFRAGEIFEAAGYKMDAGKSAAPLSPIFACGFVAHLKRSGDNDLKGFVRDFEL